MAQFNSLSGVKVQITVRMLFWNDIFLGEKKPQTNNKTTSTTNISTEHRGSFKSKIVNLPTWRLIIDCQNLLSPQPLLLGIDRILATTSWIILPNYFQLLPKSSSSFLILWPEYHGPGQLAVGGSAWAGRLDKTSRGPFQPQLLCDTINRAVCQTS